MVQKIRITHFQQTCFAPTRDMYDHKDDDQTIPGTIEEMLLSDALDTRTGNLDILDLIDDVDGTNIDKWTYEIVEVDNESGKEISVRTFDLNAAEDGLLELNAEENARIEENAHSWASESQAPHRVGTVTDTDEGIKDYG